MTILRGVICPCVNATFEHSFAFITYFPYHMPISFGQFLCSSFSLSLFLTSIEVFNEATVFSF